MFSFVSRCTLPTTRFALFVLAVWIAAPGAAFGQDAPESSSKAATMADPEIAVDHLQVMLRPMTQEALQPELQGWIDLLQAKIVEVGDVELELKGLSETDPGDALKKRLMELRTEETAIVERTILVLDALKTKGGDVETEQQFIDAVSDIGETTDATSRWVAIVAAGRNWIQRDDGGKLWARRAIVAFVLLLFFWIISKFAGRLTARAIARHPHTSNLLENFARRTAGGVVLIVGVLTALGVLGVEIGPLMAALGAGGFIVGFALQETLGSFASGLMLMVYRPFDVDDYVSVAGVEGKVQAMSLVSTTLLTVDNKTLIIPNKMAWSDTITNFTSRDLRRVDLVFGIGYDDDIQSAIDVLESLASGHDRVLADPPLVVKVHELADSSVNLVCRPWVKTEDYWTVYWDLMRQVKETFDAKGISIPYPQRDVHMIAEHNGANPS